MEPIFRNEYFISRNIIAQHFKMVSPFKKKVIYFGAPILGYCLLALCIFMRNKGISAIYGYTAITVVFLLVLAHRLTVYKREAKKGYSMMLMNKQDDLLRIVEFGEQITKISPSTGVNIMFSYSDIERIHENRNLFILFFPKTEVIVSKSGFIIGEEKDFFPFLQGRIGKGK